jgi:hypothetical protein
VLGVEQWAEFRRMASVERLSQPALVRMDADWPSVFVSVAG